MRVESAHNSTSVEDDELDDGQEHERLSLSVLS